jgi:hypothetical protein
MLGFELGLRIKVRVQASGLGLKLGFRVRVWGLGLKLGFRVRVWSLGLKLGFRVRVWGLGLKFGFRVRVWGLGLSLGLSAGHQAEDVANHLRRHLLGFMDRVRVRVRVRGWYSKFSVWMKMTLGWVKDPMLGSRRN